MLSMHSEVSKSLAAELSVAAPSELSWLHEHKKAKIWVSLWHLYFKIGNNIPPGKHMNVKRKKLTS